MLTILAEGPRPSLLRPRNLLLEVHRGFGVRHADYWCAAHDAFGGFAGEGRLHTYPRWSEPLTGFAARCLAALPADGRWSTLSALSGERVVTIVRGHRTLRRLRATFDASHGELAIDTRRIELSMEERSDLAIWRAMLALDGFNSLEPPPVPAALRVPLYQSASGAYCRTADLPAEAREAYGRWRACVPHAWTMSGPADVQDAASPVEVARFLTGVS